jgi:hypothetical protein
VRRPPQLTALQEAQNAIRDLLLDARATLDRRAYSVFVEFVCELVAREAGRMAEWRRGRDEDEAA